MQPASDTLRPCTVAHPQAIFAVLAPGKIVPNLVAGAIAEAGAQQAGDMMQDFKCVLALVTPCLFLPALQCAAAVQCAI